MDFKNLGEIFVEKKNDNAHEDLEKSEKVESYS
jgi:chaperonin cofactor prefoldin